MYMYEQRYIWHDDGISHLSWSAIDFSFFTDAIVIMQIMCSISPCKLLTIDTESYRWSDRFETSLFYVYCQDLWDDQSSSIYNNVIFLWISQKKNVLILRPINSRGRQVFYFFCMICKGQFSYFNLKFPF